MLSCGCRGTALSKLPPSLMVRVLLQDTWIGRQLAWQLKGKSTALAACKVMLKLIRQGSHIACKGRLQDPPLNSCKADCYRAQCHCPTQVSCSPCGNSGTVSRLHNRYGAWVHFLNCQKQRKSLVLSDVTHNPTTTTSQHRFM